MDSNSIMAFRVREGKGGGLEVVEMTETPSSVLKQHQECDSAEMAGKLKKAQPILARLNHHQHLVGPLDVVLKMGAYKAFSEESPVAHFLNFTSNQALLDAFSATGGHRMNIHILDFHIGLGAQWASLLHDLTLRCPSATLRITAFLEPNNSPLELAILNDTLGSFAAQLGVPFHLHALALHALPLLRPTPGELLAVSLPDWSAAPGVVRLLRQLSPTILLCSGTFLLHPDLASAGFAPLPLSALAHAQAECLLTRSPAAGFQVDRRHGELALCWHHRPIVSVSAWTCS